MFYKIWMFINAISILGSSQFALLHISQTLGLVYKAPFNGNILWKTLQLRFDCLSTQKQHFHFGMKRKQHVNFDGFWFLIWVLQWTPLLWQLHSDKLLELQTHGYWLDYGYSLLSLLTWKVLKGIRSKMPVPSPSTHYSCSEVLLLRADFKILLSLFESLLSFWIVPLTSAGAETVNFQFNSKFKECTVI